MKRGTICEHRNWSKLDNPQFPRIKVTVCDDCLQMTKIFVDELEVWRTHR